jgi:DNA primase
MNSKKIVRLLRVLGAENIEEGDEWVRASCPFAPFLHRKRDGTPGTDSRPSFGISIGKRSHYHCFACQKSGPLPILVTSLEFLTGKDFDKARAFVFANESAKMEDYDDDSVDEPNEVLSVLPKVLLRRYSPAHTHLDICRRRNLTAATIEHFSLRFDAAKARLILPVFDSLGRLVGIRGRACNDNDRIKYLEYTEVSPTRSSPKAHGVWFGQQFPPEKNKKLILVEGELDAIKLWQHLKRPGIWAAMGASISKEQLKTLEGIRNNPIILFMDNDAAGEAATKKIIKHLKGVVPNIYRVKNYASLKDPDEIVDCGKIREAFSELEKVG